MTFVWDWNQEAFNSLHHRVKLSKRTRIGGRPFQVRVSPERSFCDEGVAPEDTIGFTAKILVPKE